MPMCFPPDNLYGPSGSEIILGTNGQIDLIPTSGQVTTIQSATTITGVTAIQTTSTTAFRVQTALGASTLFIVDTTNMRVGINSLPAENSASLWIWGPSAGGNNVYQFGVAIEGGFTATTRGAAYYCNPSTGSGGGVIPIFADFFGNVGSVATGTTLTENYNFDGEGKLNTDASGTTSGTTYAGAAKFTVSAQAATAAGAVANNYGLRITGNGGTASGGGTVNNWAIHSDSTAPSQLNGGLIVIGAPAAPAANTANQNAQLTVAAGDNGGTGNSTSQILFYRGTSLYGGLGFNTDVTTVIAGHTKVLTDLALTAGNSLTALIDTSGNLYLKAGVSLGGNLTLDAVNIVTDTTTGMKIGTVGGSAGQKVGFFAATPIVQPLLATGASHTVDDVITTLQNLGLCRQS